jgi:hypothetical protein
MADAPISRARLRDLTGLFTPRAGDLMASTI